MGCQVQKGKMLYDYAQRISESHEEVEVGVAKLFQNWWVQKRNSSTAPCLRKYHRLNLTMRDDNWVDEFSMAAWNPWPKKQKHIKLCAYRWRFQWHVVDGTGTKSHHKYKRLTNVLCNSPVVYQSLQSNKGTIAKNHWCILNKATHVLTFGIGGTAMGYGFYSKRSSSKRSRTNVEAKSYIAACL